MAELTKTANHSSVIEHVVVLMLENRSFDHMLGALSLPAGAGGAGRKDVNGLKGNEFNQLNGKNYSVFPLRSNRFQDEPCHDYACVQRQLRHDNGGFAFDFEAVRKKEEIAAVMGYLTIGSLPVYDFLVDNFMLCDRWHCSVPGPTWPNRIYSLAGESDGQHDNHMPHVGFSLRTIFDYLDDAKISWGYYAHDRVFSFLRVFRRFMAGNEISSISEFFDGAEKGLLPSVVWLEPEFGTRPGAIANDDHPPADLNNGQSLVRAVYQALRKSTLWEKTLFILTYDEHGGFFDHVVPPAAADKRVDFRQYGLRVPGFVISPWVPAGVCDTIFDHTSILRTILERFCKTPDGSVPSFGDRTDHAASFWSLLTLDEARTIDVSPPAIRMSAKVVESVAIKGMPIPTSSRDALLLAVGGQALSLGVPNVR